MARRVKETKPLVFNCYVNGVLVKPEDLKSIQVTNQGYIDLVERFKQRVRNELEGRDDV